MRKFYRATFGPDDTSVPGSQNEETSPTETGGEEELVFNTPIYDSEEAEIGDMLDEDFTEKIKDTPKEDRAETSDQQDVETPDGDQETGDKKEEEKPKEGAAPVVEKPNELEELRTQVSALNELVKSLQKDESSTQKKVETPKPQTPDEAVKELFASLDLDDVMDDKEKFAEFMLKFASAISSGTLSTVQNFEQVKTYKSIHDQFYEKHKPLSHIKEYVGQTAEKIYAENPDMPLDEVLEKTAEKVYETLGIKREEEKPAETPATSSKPAKPSLPGSKNVRTTAAKTTGLVNEIEELLTD